MAPLYKNHNLIVLLIILGVAAGVLICWAGFRFFSETQEETRSPPNDQMEYMREVKMRNVRDLAAMMGRRDVLEDYNERLRPGV